MTNFEYYKTKEATKKAYRIYEDSIPLDTGYLEIFDWLYEEHKDQLSEDEYSDMKSVFEALCRHYHIRDCDRDKEDYDRMIEVICNKCKSAVILGHDLNINEIRLIVEDDGDICLSARIVNFWGKCRFGKANY